MKCQYPIGTRVQYTFGTPITGTVVGYKVQSRRLVVVIEVDGSGLHLRCSPTFLRQTEGDK